MACLVSLLVGCADSTDPTVTGDSTAIASAVRIEAEGCGPRTRLGMGTTIDDGVVITAAHVVAGADRVTVVGNDGRRAHADVVAFDPDLDIAALRPDRPVATPIALRSDPATAGDVGVVVIAGDDGAMEVIPVTVVRTVDVHTTDIYLAADAERPGFEIEASIESGDSGTMVHLPGGASGVVWARSTLVADRAWAVSLPPDSPTSSDPVDTGPCT